MHFKPTEAKQSKIRPRDTSQDDSLAAKKKMKLAEPEKDSPFPIAALPNDHLALVFAHLATQELLAVRRVALRWYNLALSPNPDRAQQNSSEHRRRITARISSPKIKSTTHQPSPRLSSLHITQHITALELTLKPEEKYATEEFFAQFQSMTQLQHITTNSLESAVLIIHYSRLVKVTSIESCRGSTRYDERCEEIVLPSVTTLKFTGFVGFQLPIRHFPNLKVFEHIEGSLWASATDPFNLLLAAADDYPFINNLSSLTLSTSRVTEEMLVVFMSLASLTTLHLPWAKKTNWMLIESSKYPEEVITVSSRFIHNLHLPHMDNVKIDMPALTRLVVDFCDNLDLSLCPSLRHVEFVSKARNVPTILDSLSNKAIIASLKVKSPPDNTPTPSTISFSSMPMLESLYFVIAEDAPTSLSVVIEDVPALRTLNLLLFLPSCPTSPSPTIIMSGAQRLEKVSITAAKETTDAFSRLTPTLPHLLSLSLDNKY